MVPAAWLVVQAPPVLAPACRSQGGGSDVRVWFLSLVAGPDYPTQCPTIKFTSKINMTGVDSKGNVSGAVRQCMPAPTRTPQAHTGGPLQDCILEGLAAKQHPEGGADCHQGCHWLSPSLAAGGRRDVLTGNALPSLLTCASSAAAHGCL